MTIHDGERESGVNTGTDITPDSPTDVLDEATNKNSVQSSPEMLRKTSLQRSASDLPVEDGAPLPFEAYALEARVKELEIAARSARRSKTLAIVRGAASTIGKNGAVLGLRQKVKELEEKLLEAAAREERLTTDLRSGAISLEASFTDESDDLEEGDDLNEDKSEDIVFDETFFGSLDVGFGGDQSAAALVMMQRKFKDEREKRKRAVARARHDAGSLY